MRKQSILVHEGQALAIAGNHGATEGVQHTRCVIDGCMNALIRLEGSEDAAKFAFALADRVAGGVKEPTGVFPRQVAAAAMAKHWMVIWVIGFFCGLLVGMTPR